MFVDRLNSWISAGAWFVVYKSNSRSIESYGGGFHISHHIDGSCVRRLTENLGGVLASIEWDHSTCFVIHSDFAWAARVAVAEVRGPTLHHPKEHDLVSVSEWDVGGLGPFGTAGW